MAKKVLLVGEEQLKNATVLEKNVDSKLLRLTIQQVQDTQLKGVLGTDLYNTLLDEVAGYAASGTTLPTLHNTLLVEYIQPFLIHAVMVDLIVLSNYHVSNKGVMKLKDDVGQTVSASEGEYLRDYYQNYAATYKQALVDFIQKNKLVSAGEQVDQNTTTASIGWYLENVDQCR